MTAGQITGELLALIDAVPRDDRWRVVIRFVRWLKQCFPENGADSSDDDIAALLEGLQGGLERTCSVCGCTEHDACEGGCAWVAADLCTACDDRHQAAAGKAGKPIRSLSEAYAALQQRPAGQRLVDGGSVDDLRCSLGHMAGSEGSIAIVEEALLYVGEQKTKRAMLEAALKRWRKGVARG